MFLDSRIFLRRLSSRNHEQYASSQSRDLKENQLRTGNNRSHQLVRETQKPRRVHPRFNKGAATRKSRVQLRKLHRLQALLEYIEKAPIAKASLAIHANAGPTFQVQQEKQVIYI